MDNGKLGELTAKTLWPDITLTSGGSVDDRNGIDGYLDGKKVQIKYDGAITKTGNVYIELYEKSIGRINQEWRTSKVAADSYIFVTPGRAYLVTVNALAEAVKTLSGNNTLKCRAISETSIGFLIPLSKLRVSETRFWNSDIKRQSKGG